MIIGSETCDDGNQIDSDGCSSSCVKEQYWDCIGVGQGSCNPICGDGTIIGSETCDDGGQVPNDGCDANCQIETNACAADEFKDSSS